MNIRTALTALSLTILLLPISGCQTAYYQTMEKLGVHKRDVLVSRVEKARDSQQEAKEQFASALEQFSAVVKFSGGDLEAKYRTLKEAYDDSADKAEAVRQRIAAVEDVAEALFKEWQAELDQYSSQSLRNQSQKQLGDTRRQYDRLITAMQRAETKIAPVLAAFKDQVLFVKHNLNARAISSLQNELLSVESDIAVLIREMEKSIGEADAFIKSMLKEG